MTKKSVLFVASEGLPFIKTGGLADVVGSLPKELVKQGLDEGLSFLFIKRLQYTIILTLTLYQALMCEQATFNPWLMFIVKSLMV